MNISNGGIPQMKNKEFPYCPNCFIPCNITPISTFDKDGARYGGIFCCPRCGWFDFDNLIDPKDLENYTNNVEKLEVTE